MWLVKSEAIFYAGLKRRQMDFLAGVNQFLKLSVLVT